MKSGRQMKHRSARTIPSVSMEKHPFLCLAIFRIPIKSRWMIGYLFIPSIVNIRHHISIRPSRYLSLSILYEAGYVLQTLRDNWNILIGTWWFPTLILLPTASNSINVLRWWTSIHPIASFFTRSWWKLVSIEIRTRCQEQCRDRAFLVHMSWHVCEHLLAPRWRSRGYI